MTVDNAYEIGMAFKESHYPSFIFLKGIYDFGEYFVVFFNPLKDKYDPEGYYNKPLVIYKDTGETKSIFFTELLLNEMFLNKEYTVVYVSDIITEQ